MKTRIILRKTSPGGFWARVVIYDSVEQKITSGDALGEDAVSFVFESNPGSYYYAMAEGVSVSEHGTYELLVKEE